MKRSRLRILLVLLFSLTAIAILFFQKAEQKVMDGAEEGGRRPLYGHLLTSLVFRELDGDSLLMKVEAEEAYYLRDGESLRMRRPVVHYFDESMNRTRIAGKKGRLSSKTGDAYVEGDVRVEYHDGSIMLAEELSYNNKKRQISSNGPVDISSSSLHIRGVGFRSGIESFI